MNERNPMERLRRANPVPVLGDASPTPARGILRRLLQGGLVLLGVLVIGAGASWATTGTNPLTAIFEKEVDVVESDYGLDSFSILEPMSQEAFEALPPRIAERVLSEARTTKLMEEMMEVTKAGPDQKKEKETMRRVLHAPAEISAIGRGTMSDGNEVTMMVTGDRVCALWAGGGSCGSLESLREGIMIGGSPEFHDPNLWKISAVVTDEVASIKIDGSDDPPIPVSANAFQLRNMPPRDVRIIGLDEDGNEVLRGGAPIGGWASMGD